MAYTSLVVVFGIFSLVLEGDFEGVLVVLAGMLFYVGVGLYVRAVTLLIRHRTTLAALTRKQAQILLLPIAAWAVSTILMPLSQVLLICGLPYLLALAGVAWLARR